MAGACPVSPSRPANAYSPEFGSGPAFGGGPVYALFAGGLWTRPDGWLAGKVLWMAAPAATGQLTVSGHQVDGQGHVTWDSGSTSLEFDARHAVAPSEWSGQPSTILVRSPGCYALDVTGPGVRETITITIA
jgi:hypothetical protein